MEREYPMTNTIDDGVAAVAKDFVNKYRPQGNSAYDDAIAEVVKRAKVEPLAKKTSPTASKKSQARALFVAGHTATEVASILEVTYANAHYHLRAFRKDGGDIGSPVGGV